jgi:hypothetical protein
MEEGFPGACFGMLILQAVLGKAAKFAVYANFSVLQTNYAKL